MKRIYELIREKVVTHLTVRRTRTDLVDAEEYKKDLDEQGIVFPKVEKPHKILYQLEPELERLYDLTAKMLVTDLVYAIWRSNVFFEDCA